MSVPISKVLSTMTRLPVVAWGDSGRIDVDQLRDHKSHASGRRGQDRDSAHFSREKIGVPILSQALAERAFLAYEAALLKDFIDGSAGEKVVVGNDRLGKVAIAPIRWRLESKGIPVVIRRVSSFEADFNPSLFDAELFSDSELKNLIQNQPAVVIVDGSYSLQEEERQRTGERPHYPAAQLRSSPARCSRRCRCDHSAERGLGRGIFGPAVGH